MGLFGFCDHSKISYRKFMRFLVVRFFLGFLIGLLVLWAGRFFLIRDFMGTGFNVLSASEKFAFFRVGLLFDLKAIAFVYLPAAVLALFCFRRTAADLYQKFFWVFDLLGQGCLAALTMVNYFYFKTYDRPIDAFIFSFGNESPIAVINTLVEDYPVYLGISGFVAFLLISALIIRWLHPWMYMKLRNTIGHVRMGVPLLATGTLLCAFIFIFFLRGSLGTLPLRMEHTAVSRSALVNMGVSNGPINLYWAWKWYMKQDDIPRVHYDDLAQDFRQVGIAEINTLDPFANFKVTLPRDEYIAGNPPDVVLAIMESWGRHIMITSTGNWNPLGELATHVKGESGDYFWLNFLSGGNGTMDSISRLLFGVPSQSLSTSSYSGDKFITSFIEHYKQAGYEIVFVTGGSQSWRNIGNFLGKQGVDRVIDEASLLEDYPNATSGTWGVDDSYTFDKAFNVLSKDRSTDAAGKPRPVFMVILTVTNHPPYRIPDNSGILPPTLTPDVRGRFPYTNTEVIFGTYKYSLNELGKFITRIKDDEELGARTIIAATGDHNLRGIGYSRHPVESVLGYMVPFYLHIPDDYKLSRDIYVPERWGSHKDIMPTLMAHSLAGRNVYTLGCDMLQNSKNCKFSFAFNRDMAVPASGKYACVLSGNTGYSFASIGLMDHYIAVSNDVNTHRCDRLHAYRKLQEDLFFFQVQNQEETEKWLNDLNRVYKPGKNLQYSQGTAMNPSRPMSEETATDSGIPEDSAPASGSTEKDVPEEDGQG